MGFGTLLEGSLAACRGGGSFTEFKIKEAEVLVEVLRAEVRIGSSTSQSHEAALRSCVKSNCISCITSGVRVPSHRLLECTL